MTSSFRKAIALSSIVTPGESSCIDVTYKWHLGLGNEASALKDCQAPDVGKKGGGKPILSVVMPERCGADLSGGTISDSPQNHTPSPPEAQKLCQLVSLRCSCEGSGSCPVVVRQAQLQGSWFRGLVHSSQAQSSR